MERVRLEDVSERESSNLAQKDIEGLIGDYPVYGASGYIRTINFYHQEKDYIAIVKDGAGVGRTMFLPAKSSVIGTLQYIIPNEKVFPKYLYYAVKHMNLAKYNTGATIPHIYYKDYKNEMFWLPNMFKQQKAALILEKVEKIIEEQRQELKQFDNLIKSRFVEMFGGISDEVEVSYYINALVAGKSLAGETECKNKVLKTGAVTYDFFDETQVKNLPVDYSPHSEHLIKDGDIIISRMNTAELVGATAYVWKAPENTYLPDRLWKAKLNCNCNPIFIWQMLIQISTKKQIKREASGTSGSMKNISKSGLLNIKVKKVSINMQNQFSDFVQQVDKLKVA